MKNLRLLFVTVTMFIGSSFVFTGEPMTDTFKVYGNEVCKADIEELIVTIHGVTSVEWNPETKLMKVVYDEQLVTRHQFFMILAEAGYDNQGLRAKDKFYEVLSEACKYVRASIEE
jgi:copper chaperone CopZ